MPNLSQLLDGPTPLLVLDAASSVIQVGVLGPPGVSRWARRTQEAGTGLFAALAELEVDLGSIGAFAYCEGPGSILGIRTSAMAVRAWNALGARPTFAYFGLALVAQALGDPRLNVIADARRGLWHCLTLGGEPRRVRTQDLGVPRITPEGFRSWEPLPPGTASTPYDVAALLKLPGVAEADLFRSSPKPAG